MSVTGKHSAVELSRAEILGRIADEYYFELNRGNRPDIEQYAKQYPDLADVIRQVLPALGLLEDSHYDDLADRAALNSLSRQKILGDFRLGRELGHGGMGVVYEAEQISMGRTVALKVLPFAALLDEKAITRFKNEARAAGTLHHENIVPIHAVGNEHGIYFYAMALIQGLTLAEVTHELRQRVADPAAEIIHQLSVDDIVAKRSNSSPASTASDANQVAAASRSDTEASVVSRENDRDSARVIQGILSTRRSLFGSRFYDQVTRIGIQVADALHHAHEHGIVHRDIKPANLMVDGAGKVWVTDFGLARIESAAGITMTGDLLGTLRYMAPEQALARRTVVDNRVDIYSLGATLYELLTLRPVLDGDSRERLLQQLTFDEAKPIRHFQPAVPADLETIVLKAIAKDPDERYATAAELADDLRAFQQRKPIKARPISVWQRCVKWAMRHQAFVAAASLVLLITAVVFAAATVAISQQQSKTKQALGTAEANWKESERQRIRAEHGAQLALDAVDNLYTEFAATWIANETAPSMLQQAFLDRSTHFYEKVLNSGNGLAMSPELAARSQERLGMIHLYLEQFEDAVDPLRASIDRTKALLAKQPADTDLLETLAHRHSLLCESLTKQARYQEAQDANGESIAIAKQLTETPSPSPAVELQLADYQISKVRLLLAAGQVEQAKELVREVQQRTRSSRESDELFVLSEVNRMHADQLQVEVLLLLEDYASAQQICTTGLAKCRQFRAQYLHDDRSLIEMEVRYVVLLGDIAKANQQLAESVKHYRAALALKQQTLPAGKKPERAFMFHTGQNKVDFDGMVEHGPFCGYVEIQLKLADALRRSGHTYLAELVLGECELVSMGLVAHRPQSLRYRVACANTWARVAELLAETRPNDAQAATTFAAANWNRARQEFPAAAAYQSGIHGHDPDLAWFERTFPGSLAGAIDVDFEQAKSDAFDTYFWRHSIASSYFRDGDWETSAWMFQTLTETSTINVAHCRLYAAMARAELGQLDEADRWFQMAASTESEASNDADLELLRSRTSERINAAAKHAPPWARGVFDFVEELGQRDHPQLHRPLGLTICEDGSLFVANGHPASLLRFHGETFEHVDEFVPAGIEGTKRPIELAVRKSRLFVTDRTGVAIFDTETGAIRDFLATSADARPYDIAFDRDGQLYVSDQMNRVLKYSDQRKVFEEFVSAENGGLNAPRGIAFGPDHHLYVANKNSHNVLKFDGTTGDFLGVFVSAGSAGLDNPIGLAFGEDGYLYVTSQKTNTVLRFDAVTGDFVDAAVSSGHGGMRAPRDLVFDGDDLLVTGRLSNRVYRYRRKTTIGTSP